MIFFGVPVFDTRAECTDWVAARAAAQAAPVNEQGRVVSLGPPEPPHVSIQPQHVESVRDCGDEGVCRVRMASGDVFWVPLSRLQLIEGWSQILARAGRRQALGIG